MRKSFFLFLVSLLVVWTGFAQNSISYTLSFPRIKENLYHASMEISGLKSDSLLLKMPNWMPGYYQFMHYANNLRDIKASSSKQHIGIVQTDSSTWRVATKGFNKITVEYDVLAQKKFVANSFADETHAYLVPGNSFMYIPSKLSLRPAVKIVKPSSWLVATGLHSNGNDLYTADDFDILYDCPILMGPLEEIPSFKVGNKLHRFAGYQLGDFDKQKFSNDLQKIVTAAAAIIGDIPYDQYIFIAIGPGGGGIEHLNNATVSFSGAALNNEAGKYRMYSFLAHEYFHHYNVKRIRPVELGPFDYENGKRTTQLWISEGLTVYYEYLIVKRAGLTDEAGLLRYFEKNLNTYENDPGRKFQSLIESSYQTWEEGPFGENPGQDSVISYYEKGPLVGLLLDFEIRHATQNKHSLDDVMRTLYYHYYKKLQRGFTDAEFRYACEEIAGRSLEDFFRYIYNTKELDYKTYLGYAGLALEEKEENGKRRFTIKRLDNLSPLQAEIYKSWMGK
ncbi:MAG: hypothetical protein QM687_00905 [Ferruginibacter sp.]